MRPKRDIKPIKATFQVVMDALALTPFYRAFLDTKDFPAIYMQEFWATVLVHRFTKIIIDYFMLKDQFILRRNTIFWHTARDDTMYNFIRYVSRHEKNRAYGSILLKELTNQAMLESQAYQTYYTFASREKTPKPKYVRKKANSNTSPKQKPAQPTKGTRIRTKAKVAKSDKEKQPAKMPKAKVLAMLSEVALTKAEQLKLPTKKARKTFTYHMQVAHVKDSTLSQSNEEDDDENDFEEETYTYDDDSDDNDDSDDERTESDSDVIPDPNKSNEKYDKQEKEYDDEFNVKEKEKIDDEETMYDDEDDKVTKELYEDVNVNMGNKDADMTNADQGGADQQNVSQQTGFEHEEEDAHVTLTHVLKTQKTRVHHEITSATTIPLPPHFFNPPQQEATPTPTPITSEAITSFSSLLDFASVFKFNERVTNLEKDLGVKMKEKMIKTPLLDQTEGQKEETQVKILSHPEIQKEPSHTVEDSGKQQDQEFVTGENDEQPADKEVAKADWFKKPKRPPTLDPDWDEKLTFDLLRPGLVKLHMLKNLLLHLMSSMIFHFISLHLS
nr:hypothetical protein [Tanacetum cinerariifolium]